MDPKILIHNISHNDFKHNWLKPGKTVEQPVQIKKSKKRKIKHLEAAMEKVSEVVKNNPELLIDTDYLADIFKLSQKLYQPDNSRLSTTVESLVLFAFQEGWKLQRQSFPRFLEKFEVDEVWESFFFGAMTSASARYHIMDQTLFISPKEKFAKKNLKEIFRISKNQWLKNVQLTGNPTPVPIDFVKEALKQNKELTIQDLEAKISVRGKEYGGIQVSPALLSFFSQSIVKKRKVSFPKTTSPEIVKKLIQCISQQTFHPIEDEDQWECLDIAHQLSCKHVYQLIGYYILAKDDSKKTVQKLDNKVSEHYPESFLAYACEDKLGKKRRFRRAQQNV